MLNWDYCLCCSGSMRAQKIRAIQKRKGVGELKKTIILLILMLLLAACGCNHEYDSGTIMQEATCSEEGTRIYRCTLCGDERQESIPCVPHEYEDEITREATFDSTGEMTYTCIVCGDSYTEEIPVKERTVVVTVVDKTNIPEDIYNDQYSDRVEFIFSVENQSDEPVKGIEGILHIQDLFGKEILSINCDFTGEAIPPNGSIRVDDLGIDINQFNDNEVKLYNENFEDLNFEYEILDIVYEGEPTEEGGDTQHDDLPVSVIVTGKENLPEDIYNGRYSPVVQLTIEVTNLTDKEIQGISGVLRISDLFGKEIIASTCDFTGQTILPGEMATYTDLGLEVNQFMDDHVKLYNERYEDLNFEYEISSIVYTDGSSETY